MYRQAIGIYLICNVEYGEIRYVGIYYVYIFIVYKYGGTDHIIVKSMITFNAQVGNMYIFNM